MIIGNLDRQIVIQRATQTQDGAGQYVDTWATLRTEWAAVDPNAGNERFRDHQEVDVLRTEFRIRWFDGLLAKDRISYDGEIYNIKRIEEKGHRKREFIDIMAERIVQGAGR